jgi:transglutaminase-like putative cysteine protease
MPQGEPLRAGRKIYDYLIDTMVYNYKAPGAGTGNAVWACDSKTGDCTDYHSVFIGLCRWRGIPADHVFGLPMPPDKHEGDIRYCHCWAQFWVAGVGWIPIDASRADKFPDDRDYYFGTLGSTWLTLAHGRDVVLEPPQKGPPENMFHGPVAEVDGRPFEGVRWLAHYKDEPETAAAR